MNLRHLQYVLIFYNMWEANFSMKSCSWIPISNIVFQGRCPIINLANGVVTYNRSPGGGLYPFTTMASITCDSGYYGPIEVRCFYQEYWGPYTPRCDQGKKLCSIIVIISLNQNGSAGLSCYVNPLNLSTLSNHNPEQAKRLKRALVTPEWPTQLVFTTRAHCTMSYCYISPC